MITHNYDYYNYYNYNYIFVTIFIRSPWLLILSNTFSYDIITNHISFQPFISNKLLHKFENSISMQHVFSKRKIVIPCYSN